MKRGQYTNCKSQIAIFVIISILLIISIATIFYFSSISKKNVTENISTLSSSEIINRIEERRDNCLENKTLFAIDAYGLNEENIQNFLSQNIPSCIQPVINEYKSVSEITNSLFSVEVKINDEKIEVTGTYPISVKKEDTQTINEFSLVLPRTISTNLVHGILCQVIGDYYMKSWDDKFEIFVLEGTKMQYANGTCLDNMAIRIEDPILTYGDRATSLTSLVYIPQPLGAEFSVKNVQLKQKYTDKDYADYYASLNDIAKPVMGQDKLRIEYYDKPSNNFYVYPSPNSVNITSKEINANVDIFYDGFLHHSSSKISKKTVIESFDRRISIVIPENTMITKDGNNVNKVSIEIKPKTSNVVNFGFSDYEFSPDGAIIEPSVSISYKYTQEEAEAPEYRYGGYNWQNFINNTWQDPRVYKLDITSLRATHTGNQVTFSFKVVNDLVQILNCNLYINNTLIERANVQNGTAGTFTETLGDGKYSWQIGCSDTIGEEKSAVQEVNVGSVGGTYSFFLPLSNLVKQTGYIITGFVTSEDSSRNGLNAREESELRLVWFDETDRVYKPWPTYVNEDKKIITGIVNHFTTVEAGKGCEDTKYGKFIVNTVDDNEGVADQWCNESKSEDSPVDSVGYEITADNSCTESITIRGVTTEGDTQGTFNPSLETLSNDISFGKKYFNEKGLTNTDRQFETGEDHDVCARTRTFIKTVGIGYTTQGSYTVSNEAEWDNATGLSGWDISLCASYPAEKQEACAVCVRFSQEDIAAGGGRVGKAGDTMQDLAFCTEIMYGEGACSWTDTCSSMAASLQYACSVCYGWCSSGAEGFGSTGTTSGTLEHCAEVMASEGEESPTPTNNGTYTPGNCKELGGTYNRSTEQFLGYGLVRYWLDLSNAEVIAFADQLAANNLTATYIEYFGMDVHVGRYDIINHPENVYAKAKFLVETMRARNITTFINYINWNAPDICTNNPFTDAWFQNSWGGLAQQIGTDNVIMQTAVEGGERCTDKFTRWNNWMAGHWTGMKSYSLSGGTKTAPSAEWFISPTPGIDGEFATGAIVTTDDGTTLRYFSDMDGQGNVDPAKLENYAGGINIPCHSGFIYYDFGYDGKKPDVGAIQALGRVAAKKSKPVQTAPNITITSPENGKLYTTLSIPLTGQSNQANIVNISYKLNEGSLIYPSLPHNITAREGENRLDLYVKNSAGLIGSATSTFQVEVSQDDPIIEIISPKSEEYEISLNLNRTLLNVTSNQIVTWKYSLNGAANVTIYNPSSQIRVNNGENNLVVYGVNSNGTGQAEVSFNVALIDFTNLPKINLISPSSGVIYTSKLIHLDTTSNQEVSIWSYSINSMEKTVFTPGDYYNFFEGENNLVVYGKNSNGTGSAYVYFSINSTAA